MNYICSIHVLNALKLLLLAIPQVPLMILQNRSSSRRFSEETKEQLKDDGSNYVKFEGESNHFTDSKLWSLMVRMISFFFITSRLVFNSFYFVLEFSSNFVLPFYCLNFPLVVKLCHSYSRYS